MSSVLSALRPSNASPALLRASSDSFEHAVRQQTHRLPRENSEHKTLRFVALLVILSLFVNMSAKADTVETFGRGIQDKKSGQVIQLICTNMNIDSGRAICDQAAFFEIGNPKAPALWKISSDLNVSERSDIKALRKKVRKAIHRENRRTKDPLVGFYVVPGAFFLGLATLAIANGDDVEFGTYSEDQGRAIIGGVAALVLVGALFGFQVLDIFHGNPLISTSTTLSTFDQQNGWNWSENPKSVSSKRYNRIKNAIWDMSHQAQ